MKLGWNDPGLAFVDLYQSVAPLKRAQARIQQGSNVKSSESLNGGLNLERPQSRKLQRSLKKLICFLLRHIEIVAAWLSFVQSNSGKILPDAGCRTRLASAYHRSGSLVSTAP